MTPGRRNSAAGFPGPGRFARAILCLVLGLPGYALPALAAPISNPVATFSGLDKITARITNFDVYINETVQFGSLQITPRVCYTRPPNESQRTSVFVEVDQVSIHGGSKRILTGWMFADSPALNAIDDAVYDFWLVDCKQQSTTPPPTATSNPAPVATAPTAPPAAAAPTPPPAAATPAAAAGAGPAASPATAAADSSTTPPPTVRSEQGSIITLLSPKPTAETSPDAH
jgi:hypothetical protein